MTTKKFKVGELEAVIKYGFSGSGNYDGVLRVFLDSTIGCGLGCNHCWIKDVSPKISESSERELDEIVLKEVGDRPYKLKLMGQGDALLYPEFVINRLNRSYYHIANRNKPQSLSVSTIFPEVKRISKEQDRLIDLCDKVYISVIDPDEKERRAQAKSALNIDDAVRSARRAKNRVFLHFTPTFENSTPEKLEELKGIFLRTKAPLRLIRHHSVDDSPVKDPVEVAEQLVDMGVSAMVCVSAGVKEKTACGMFG